MAALRRFFFELRYLLGRAPWDSGISPPELLAFLETHPPGRALDLGCGSGTHAITLAQHGWQVTAIDFASGAVRRARRKARAAGVRVAFLQGDVTDLAAVQGPLDLALDIGCYHGLNATGQARYAAALVPLLRPGGVLLLYGFLHHNPDDPATWLTDEAITRRLGDRFEIVLSTRGIDRDHISVWLTLRRKP
jgi:SAM-dependent methyltransferase